MENKNKYSKLIANYLYNDMTPEEKDLFEKDLQINEELANEFKFQSDAIRYIESKTLLEEMKSDPYLEEADRIVEAHFSSGERYQEKEEKRRIKIVSRKHLKYWLSVAAALFIGIVSLSIIHLTDPYKSLFNKYYAPFDQVSSINRGNNVSDTKMSEGIALYLDGEYEKSVKVFKELVESDQDNPLANFYLGISYLGDNQIAQAIDQFNDQLNNFDGLHPEIKWYLSLCYIKSENIPEAKKLLQQLTSSPGKTGRDSEKLLKKLGKRKMN